MTEPSSKTDQLKETSQDQNDPIENLLRQLHGQIRSSDWLEKNTAVKLEKENPELIKAWKEAVDSEKNE